MSYIPPSGIAPPRSWLEAGLRAHHRGELRQAVSAYRNALALAPEDADALNLLGAVLLQLGDCDEAVGYLERAAHKQRSNPQVLGNLGQAYLALHRHEEAFRTFRKASRLKPGQVQFQVGLAAALALQGKLNEAETLLQRLARSFPDSALVWLNLGNVMRDQQRLEQALDCYRKAAEIDDRSIEAHNSLGRTLHSMLRFEEAEARYRRCLELDQGYYPARYNLASVVIDVGRFAEAEAICRQLVASAPDRAEAHTILAAALGHQGRLLDARACHERSVELAPDSIKALESHAMALLETGRTAEGLRGMARVVAAQPESDASRQVLGAALLAHGQLQDGWAEYRRRPGALRLREKYAALALTDSLPRELANKHVCVLREQGLGDELFFLRYAPVLAARGARVTCRASSKIASVLSRVASLTQVVEEGMATPRADVYMLVGDLPHALGEHPASDLKAISVSACNWLGNFDRSMRLYWPPVPRSLALEPLQEKVDDLCARLAALGPPPYIGLTWRAGTAPEEQGLTWLLHKSIGLPALADALSPVRGTLIALQRNPVRDEIEALSQSLGRTVHDFTALNEDLESMLALLAVLDDYVGVSNTNMHLRAAVGKAARVLVPAPAEWRWMQSGRESPWFPAFSIYRQSLNGDWAAAFAALTRDLQAGYGSLERPVVY